MATDYDGQGKGHDPMCPYGPHRAPTVAPCRTCLVINKVRADERQQAAQRVEAPDLHEEWCVWARPMPLPGDRCDCYHARCIAAARGEAQ